MNNERELLELAAKAMGLELVPNMPKNDGKIDVWMDGHVVRWNPLHDQADSANLRDALDISVIFNSGSIYCSAGSRWKLVAHDDTREDRSRAVREAVLLVTAEIGRNMK